MEMLLGLHLSTRASRQLNSQDDSQPWSSCHVYRTWCRGIPPSPPGAPVPWHLSSRGPVL